MKLLIVDDSALVRRSIEAVYSGKKFTDIRTAADGLLAVSVYKEFRPDVVTLDITMPYMDGLAALTEMLEHNTNSKILVISALADHHTAIEALSRGADQFICKPFSAEDLCEALDDLAFDHTTSSDLTETAPERDQGREILERTHQATRMVKYQSAFDQPPVLQAPPNPQQYPSGYVAPPNPHNPPAVAPPIPPSAPSVAPSNSVPYPPPPPPPVAPQLQASSQEAPQPLRPPAGHPSYKR